MALMAAKHGGQNNWNSRKDIPQDKVGSHAQSAWETDCPSAAANASNTVTIPSFAKVPKRVAQIVCGFPNPSGANHARRELAAKNSREALPGSV